MGSNSWLDQVHVCLEAHESSARTEEMLGKRTGAGFSDFPRGVCASHILPIETDLAEVPDKRELLSNFIEVDGLDFNDPVGRTEDDKFLSLGPVNILYVF